MGGNVFDFVGPIKREHIEPTLLNFFSELKKIFPNAGPYFSQMKTLGSVGKKPSSGDIDLALSGKAFDNIEDWGLDRDRIITIFDLFRKRAKTSTDEQLMKRAVIVGVAEKIQESGSQIGVDIKGSGAGALFLAFPQYDETNRPVGSSVQIDINVGDVDWLEFAYYSDKYEGNVKGLHRTQLMLSLFSNAGYTFSHNYGVKDKETQEIVADNPKQAIQVLNNFYGISLTPDILSNYFSLQKYIKQNIPNVQLDKIYDTFVKILDSTRADIPEDLQQYWIDNQQRLGLKGKFLPDDSNLKKYSIQ